MLVGPKLVFGKAREARTGRTQASCRPRELDSSLDVDTDSPDDLEEVTGLYELVSLPRNERVGLLCLETPRPPRDSSDTDAV